MSVPERQVLLEHVGFLRAIALGVLHNEADADDVVQQTLTAAIEKPPHDPSNLRGWLATVARNFARMHYRGRKRRHAREERVARAEGVPGTAQIAERMEMERHVVEAIATLDEPFRATLVLRYYDDLQPKEIAERMGIPAGTVRTRLKRGLSKLRERLERDCEGDRRLMCAGLLLLAQMPVPLPAPLTRRIAPAVGVGALLVGVVLTIWLVRDTEPTPTGAEPRRASARGSLPARLDSEDGASPPPVGATLRVTGRVQDERGRPIPNASVTAYPHRPRGRLETPERLHDRWLLPRPVLHEATTDRTGRYAITIDRPQPVWLVASAGAERTPGHCRVVDASGTYAGLDFQLNANPARALYVLDDAGRPIAGARVQAWDERRSETWLPGDVAELTTDALGRVLLRLPEVGERGWRRGPRDLRLRVIAPGYAPRVLTCGPGQTRIRIRRGRGLRLTTTPATRVIVVTRGSIDARYATDGSVEFAELPPDEPRTIVLMRTGRRSRVKRLSSGVIGAEIRPRAVEDGALSGYLFESGTAVPVGAAELGLARPRLLPPGFDCIDFVRSNADGKFLLRNVQPGSAGVLVAHPTLAPMRAPLDGGTSASVDLMCETGHSLEGVVRDAKGRGCGGVRLLASFDPDGALSDQLARRHEPWWSAVSRPDGSFVIRQLPASGRVRARMILTAWHPRLGSARVEVAARETVDFTLSTARAVSMETNVDVRGTIFDEAGQAIAGATLRDADTLRLLATTDDSGAFAWRGAERGSAVVETRTGIRRVARWTAVPIRIRVPAVRDVSGRVMFEGTPVPVADVRVIDVTRLIERMATGADGRFETRAMPVDPDAFLEVTCAGFDAQRFAHLFSGDIELKRMTEFTVLIRNEAGDPVADVELRDSGRPVRTGKDGTARLSAVPTVVPGTSGWIRVGEPRWKASRSVVVLVVRRGERIEGRAVDAAGAALAGALVVALPLRAGRPVRRAFADTSGRFVLRALHPERYRLRTKSSEETIEVDAGARDVILRGETR